MKNILYILLVLLLGCTPKNTPQEKLRLTFEVIPESNNYYSITWKDTLGTSEGYHEDYFDFINRPREIWCVITDTQNDTLGYYQGLSTAQTFADFHTTDSVVILNFMIGLNLFPDHYLKEEIEIRKYPIKYEPVIFNVIRGLRKEIEVELKRLEIEKSRF